MEDLGAAILDPFTGAVVPKFHIAHVLHGGSVGPIDSSFIVVVNKGGFRVVSKGRASHIKSIG